MVQASTVSKYPINLTISNVSYVPNLRNNLLSYTALMNKGCRIESRYNCTLIFDINNKFLIKAVQNENRLEVYLNPFCNPECYYSNETSNNYEIWHSRLCHLSPKYMLKMKEYIDINVM